MRKSKDDNNSIEAIFGHGEKKTDVHAMALRLIDMYISVWIYIYIHIQKQEVFSAEEKERECNRERKSWEEIEKEYSEEEREK